VLGGNTTGMADDVAVSVEQAVARQILLGSLEGPAVPDAGGCAMSLEENKALIRRHEATLNSGRVEAGLELFADPCRFNGQPISREVIRQMRTILWTAAPDVRWIAEHLVAEGDWVAVRWTMRGTHTGAFVHPTWGSAPASGMPVALSYLDHYRIADGQIAEAWEVRDGLSLREQFGLVAAPGRTVR
jgi:predicted ester cyclase